MRTYASVPRYAFAIGLCVLFLTSSLRANGTTTVSVAPSFADPEVEAVCNFSLQAFCSGTGVTYDLTTGAAHVRAVAKGAEVQKCLLPPYHPCPPGASARLLMRATYELTSAVPELPVTVRIDAEVTRRHSLPGGGASAFLGAVPWPLNVPADTRCGYTPVPGGIQNAFFDDDPYNGVPDPPFSSGVFVFATVVSCVTGPHNAPQQVDVPAGPIAVVLEMTAGVSGWSATEIPRVGEAPALADAESTVEVASASVEFTLP